MIGVQIKKEKKTELQEKLHQVLIEECTDVYLFEIAGVDRNSGKCKNQQKIPERKFLLLPCCSKMTPEIDEPRRANSLVDRKFCVLFGHKKC